MGTSRRRFLGLTAAAVGSAAVGITPAAASCRAAGTLYLGTYTSSAGGGTGIGVATYDGTTGAITSTGTLAGVQDPSFLIMAPSGRFLYAVNEQTSGGVTAVAVDAPGRLRVLNRQPNGGNAPCHLALVANGKYLLSANYGSGDVAVHPVKADGSLGARTDLVKHVGAAPHAHQVVQDPTGKYILAVDLGTDSVYTYTIVERRQADAEVAGEARDRRRTASPRLPPQRPVRVRRQRADSTITVCRYDGASGKLTPGAAQPTAPAGPPRTTPAR